ncbi:MAG: hypothetical protein K2X87_34770 [Gemmataceae bacterium]|nr:hypothetical protein [Gemmataceae bacterium]
MSRWTVGPAALLLAAGWLAAVPARETDPLLVGTKWTGTLTQKGTFAGGAAGPPEFRTVLTVTRRSGTEFGADLREQTDGLDITYVVKGEVGRAAGGKGYAVTFRSVDAKDISGTLAILGVPYAGTVAGKSLKGTWKYRPPDTATAIEGEFMLELSK